MFLPVFLGLGMFSSPVTETWFQCMAISSKEYNLLAHGVKSQKWQCIRVPLEPAQAGWPTSYVILHPLSPRVVQFLVVTCAWASFLKRRKFCFGSFFHRFQSKKTNSLLWASGRTDYVGGEGIWWQRLLTPWQLGRSHTVRKVPQGWEVALKASPVVHCPQYTPTSLQQWINQ